MNIKFIKEQFEIAKNVSHLSETIVIDINTVEWLIQRVEGLGKECFKAYTEKNLLENKLYDLRTKFQEDIEIKEKLIGTLRTSNRNYQIAFDNVCEEYQPLAIEQVKNVEQEGNYNKNFLELLRTQASITDVIELINQRFEAEKEGKSFKW